MNDQQIVELYWQRSPDAVSASIAKYGAYCHAIAYRILYNREDAELEAAVDRFLHTLSRRDCDVFLRRYYFAEPLADIARRYGLPLGTVKASLFRSREKLRNYLEKEELL